MNAPGLSMSGNCAFGTRTDVNHNLYERRICYGKRTSRWNHSGPIGAVPECIAPLALTGKSYLLLTECKASYPQDGNGIAGLAVTVTKAEQNLSSWINLQEHRATSGTMTTTFRVLVFRLDNQC